MRYYHSGINSYALIRMLAKEGVAGTINARCAHQPAIQRRLEDFPDCLRALQRGLRREPRYGRARRQRGTRRRVRPLLC